MKVLSDNIENVSVFKSKEYASGKKEYVGYYACCEAFDFCSFYKQLWFLMVCGGCALLLFCILIGVAFFLICRKRKRGSRGVSEKKEDVMSKDFRLPGIFHFRLPF
ncbi:hypothetical protein GCK72_007693 [Caenorhabditis remanei]|uniref:Uncharacterized protein n=1 Tax=Caenorhabditis remanei TaxID=31234 RepID=A0A6A5HMA0_CAERE|nr:hypothetical protein GCK72_007693 [Caenorhabditis remanei]KAF1767734.1 hypothetical protein GCK72_007693 [Caenorhabditis remanei]